MRHTERSANLKEIRSGFIAGIFGFVTAIYLIISGFLILGESGSFDALKIGVASFIIYFSAVSIPLVLMKLFRKKKDSGVFRKLYNLRKALDSVTTLFLIIVISIKLMRTISWLNLEDVLIDRTGDFVIIGLGMSLSILVYAIWQARKI